MGFVNSVLRRIVSVERSVICGTRCLVDWLEWRWAAAVVKVRNPRSVWVYIALHGRLTLYCYILLSSYPLPLSFWWHDLHIPCLRTLFSSKVICLDRCLVTDLRTNLCWIWRQTNPHIYQMIKAQATIFNHNLRFWLLGLWNRFILLHNRLRNPVLTCCYLLLFLLHSGIRNSSFSLFFIRMSSNSGEDTCFDCVTMSGCNSITINSASYSNNYPAFSGWISFNGPHNCGSSVN